MRAQSLQEQCKNVSTIFLQLRFKHQTLVFWSFSCDTLLNISQTSLGTTSESIFLWRFSFQGRGREGLKNLFPTNQFFFGPPPHTFTGGTKTEQPCGDNSQMWGSHNKTDSTNCLSKTCSAITYGSNTPDQRARGKETAFISSWQSLFLICIFQLDEFLIAERRFSISRVSTGRPALHRYNIYKHIYIYIYKYLYLTYSAS